MVGYIIGLGDRHYENIMLDEGTGETVHCDFNCLFDKVRDLVVNMIRYELKFSRARRSRWQKRCLLGLPKTSSMEWALRATRVSVFDI